MIGQIVNLIQKLCFLYLFEGLCKKPQFRCRSRRRKDAVAWDERIESATPKKTVKMEGEWKLARLLEHFTPQKLSVKIYGKLVQVEAVERFVFIRGFQPKVKVVVAKGIKEPIIFLSTDLTLSVVQIIEI